MFKNSTKFIFLFCVLNLNSIYAKIYSVCEIAQELDDLHSIPREEIYKHLCIIGTLIHTNKTLGEYLGIYRISQQWWCGQDVPGGSCNVKCSELSDDDIADDVICAKKILDGHGLEGWGQSEKVCQQHQEKVESCLVTIDEFEDDIEESLRTSKKSYTTSKSTTTAVPLIQESMTKFPQFLSDRDKKFEENSFLSVRSLFIFLMLMFTVITVVTIYTRYHRIERLFRATFTDAVQLI